VLVVRDRTDKTVFYGQLVPRPAFDANEESMAAVAPLRYTFPEAGRYTIQVWFFQAQGRDVIKGEVPFSVESRGD